MNHSGFGINDMSSHKELKRLPNKDSHVAGKTALALQAYPKKRFPVPYDPFQTYLFEINQYKLLTREEENVFAVRVREKMDQIAIYRLVTSNLRLVVKIAMGFYRYGAIKQLDLIQEGNLGLLQAARKFDPYRGIKFSYYASFWIRAYILKFILDNWKLVKIGTTQSQRKLFFNLGKERDKLTAQGFSPEPRLLAERLGVKEEEVVQMSQRLAGQEISLSSPVSDDSKEPYEALLPHPDREIDEQLSEEQNRKIFTNKLKEFRKTLSGKEADIFDNRIMSEKPLTLQKLGDKYKISRERVRQVQVRIVKDIENWLRTVIPNFEEEYVNIMK